VDSYRGTLSVLCLAACALLLAGCSGKSNNTESDTDTKPGQATGSTEKPRPPSGSRITKENYDKIKIGMTKREVEAILGHNGQVQNDPKPPGDTSEKIIWRDGKKLIQVVFKDGKVFMTLPKDL